MNITYTHGDKVWRFAAVPNDSTADLDVSRLCVSGAANDVARRVLADYIQMTATEKIIDTANDDPLAHFVARSVWAVIAPPEPLPVTARWAVPELGAQELFIPCGMLPTNTKFYAIDEWALEALMSNDSYVREVAVEINTSERVYLPALQDQYWGVRRRAVETSTSERVHLAALQDGDWQVRQAAVETSTSERVHLAALQDTQWHIREAVAAKSTSKKVLDIVIQDKHIAVRQAAERNPAFKSKLNRDACT